MSGNAPTPKVDLQDVVEEWAKDYFRRRASAKERKLQDKEQIQLDIDWKNVKFVHDAPVYEPEPPKPGSGKPTNTILANTNFTNKTDKPQRYRFQTSRTTRSSCSVFIEQCHTKGVEMSVKLQTPCQILEANAGFHREMTLTNSEEETIEEEMTWSVDSEIEVLERHVGEAKLVIMEEEYQGRFSVTTHISGKVRVVYTNMKDNNSFVKAVEAPIVQILKQANVRKGPALEVVDGPPSEVRSTTRGSCKFKYGFKQLIEVDQRPINDKVH